MLRGILSVVGLLLFVSACERFGSDGVKRAAAQVAKDSVAQHEIAKRNGSATDVCVQAGLVAAAFLQAQDQEQYRVWKKTETEECAKAGMPK